MIKRAKEFLIRKDESEKVFLYARIILQITMLIYISTGLFLFLVEGDFDAFLEYIFLAIIMAIFILIKNYWLYFLAILFNIIFAFIGGMSMLFGHVRYGIICSDILIFLWGIVVLIKMIESEINFKNKKEDNNLAKRRILLIGIALIPFSIFGSVVENAVSEIGYLNEGAGNLILSFNFLLFTLGITMIITRIVIFLIERHKRKVAIAIKP